MKQSNQLTPIFLIGAGRSGTKFLRDVLSISSEITTIPYDVGYVWRYGNESVPHDELTPEMATDKIVRYVRNTLPTLAKMDSTKKPRYLLEKSVPNALRPSFLHKIYPDALFIHLIRDGRAVTESSMRMWKAPPERNYLLKKLRYFPLSNYKYAFWYFSNIARGVSRSDRGQHIWGPRYNGIMDDSDSLSLEIVCAKQWRRCVETSLEQLKSIPSNQVFLLRYEKLINNHFEISRLCDFLSINDKLQVIQHFQRTYVPSNLDKWRYSLKGDTLDRVIREIRELLVRLKYVQSDN